MKRSLLITYFLPYFEARIIDRRLSDIILGSLSAHRSSEHVFEAC